MTPSASASALGCPDILAMIFNNLAPGQSQWEDSEDANKLRQECRRALASSAAAARVLSSRALDVLWQELDDIQPLLEIIPEYKSVGSHFVSCRTYSPKLASDLMVVVFRCFVAQSCPNIGKDFRFTLSAFA